MSTGSPVRFTCWWDQKAQGTRRKTNDRVPHRGQTPLPENSLVRVEDGLEVASPEFAYLQMAARLDEVGLSSEQLDSLGLADNAFRRVAGHLGVKDRSKETRYDWQGRRSDLLRRLWQYEKVGVCNGL